MQTILPGSRVLLFDPQLFTNDFTTPLSLTVRPATVVRRYGYISIIGEYKYNDVVDVVFDHRPDKVSKAHFTDGVKIMTYDIYEVQYQALISNGDEDCWVDKTINVCVCAGADAQVVIDKAKNFELSDIDTSCPANAPINRKSFKLSGIKKVCGSVIS